MNCIAIEKSQTKIFRNLLHTTSPFKGTSDAKYLVKFFPYSGITGELCAIIP